MEHKVIFELADKVKETGATDGHFTMNNVKHTKGLTAVISVYDNVKPAHMVLEELYEWSKIHNQEVQELIESIEKDMLWNEKNPI